jgi:Uma2 family endonuclease
MEAMGEVMTHGPRPITVDEFDRMIVAGVFGPDEHVELVEGVISYAPPQDPPHASINACLNRAFCERLGRRVLVWPQLPIVVSGRTEVEPDVTLLVDRGDFYGDRRPLPQDVHAVVEVADSSLWYDRGRKLQLYAEGGIAEYWIVDVNKQRIHVYREPSGPRYDWHRAALRGETIAFAAFPDVVFSVEELLG